MYCIIQPPSLNSSFAERLIWTSLAIVFIASGHALNLIETEKFPDCYRALAWWL